MDRCGSRHSQIVLPSLLSTEPDEPALESIGTTSFPALFAGHFQYVWRSLRRLGVQPRDLEDVTHDLFTKVLRQLPERDPARPVRPWLFGFALRVAADYRRLARHRRELLGNPAEPLDTRPNSAERAEQTERLELALSVLQQIELDRRAVFILHELDGCTMNEIAEELGINVNTAYSRLRLARQDLKAIVQRLRARGAAR